MKRFVLSSIVLAMAAATGTAAAQDYYGAQSYGYEDSRYEDTYVAQDGYGNAPYGDDRYDDRYEDRYGSGYAGGYATPDRYGRSGSYDMARVLSVDPIVSRRQPAQRCYDTAPGYGDRYAYDDRYQRGYSDPYRRGYGQPRTSGTGALIGAVIGGAIGNAVADDGGHDRYGYRRGGSERAVATVLGAVVGGAIGAGVERSTVQSRDGYYRGQGYGNPGYGNQGYYGSRGYYGSQVSQRCQPVSGYGYEGGVEGYRVTYEYAGRRYQTITDYHPGNQLRVRVDVRPEG